jgi:phosphopantothenoylcysteine synthetase/decarboxylase
MARQEVLNKEFTITENGDVEILETVKKQFNKDDLMTEKQRYLAQQQQIARQVTQLKSQYDSFGVKIQEVDEMIAAIPETTL